MTLFFLGGGGGGEIPEILYFFPQKFVSKPSGTSCVLNWVIFCLRIVYYGSTRINEIFHSCLNKYIWKQPYKWKGSSSNQQLQRKSRKDSEASTGFEHMTSVIPVHSWVIAELWSLVGSRSNGSSIFTHYMKRMTLCIYDKDHECCLQIKEYKWKWSSQF